LIEHLLVVATARIVTRDLGDPGHSRFRVAGAGPRHHDVCVLDDAADDGSETEPSDRVLVRRVRLGDRSAFDEIIHRHGPGMYRFAIRMVGGDRTDAGEVVQEAFISAWKNIETFEARSALRTWLFSLVSRRAVDLQRKRRPTPVDDDFLSAVAPPANRDPLQDVMDKELVAALQAALAELPHQQRAVWLLRELEDMSYDDIATTLAMTPDSVRGQLHRGRKNLAERMAQWR
jgi:RNA polymerase sigma-70 factor (ECF subfamily)